MTCPRSWEIDLRPCADDSRYSAPKHYDRHTLPQKVSVRDVQNPQDVFNILGIMTASFSYKPSVRAEEHCKARQTQLNKFTYLKLYARIPHRACGHAPCPVSTSPEWQEMLSCKCEAVMEGLRM